jgi:hypothetical protein
MGDPGQAVERLKAQKKSGLALSVDPIDADPWPSLEPGRAKGGAYDRKPLDLGAGGT